MPVTVNLREGDVSLEPELLSDEQLNIFIEQKTKLDFQQQSKIGGFFYFAGLIGVVLIEPALPFNSPVVLSFALVLLLFAVVRFRIGSLAKQGQQFSKQLLSWVLILNVLTWALLFSWIIYKTRAINATLAFVAGANSAYVAGVIVATTGMRKLQRKVLFAMFLPPIVSFVIFMGDAPAYACIVGLLVYYYFLNNLGKVQNVIHHNALGTLIRLDLQSKALRDARNAALAASKAKSDFLSHMSHEIRTPLNGVIGASELLAHSTHDPQLQGYVKIIQSSGDLLMGLLNNILDFTRISSQASTLAVTSVDITELANGLLAMMQPMADKKGIRLLYHAGPQLPSIIRVDRLRLQQVITNLLTNALKFTKTGSITLQLTTTTNADGAMILRGEIVDTGIGIADDNLVHIFEQFTQVENFHPDIRGVGLGLNICKQLVTLMGGELGVTSEVGKGSTFWFDIPITLGEITTASAAPAQPTDSELPQSAPSQSTLPTSTPPTSTSRIYKQPNAELPEVLVAEDNLVNQKVILQFLKRFHVSVRLTSNGQEVVDSFASQQPDLVLMDYNMPVLDGLAATQKIRAIESEKGWLRTPVVALTAHAFQDSIQQCLDAGMDDHLSKPMRLADCANLVDKWLKPKADF
jgi:signal transduction histidine kinase/ActR/RegA family two-component response regulator